MATPTKKQMGILKLKGKVSDKKNYLYGLNSSLDTRGK